MLNKLLNDDNLINDPSETFVMQISEKSREALKDQLNIHKHMIKEVGVKQRNYPLLNEKLNDLKFMADVLDINTT